MITVDLQVHNLAMTYCVHLAIKAYHCKRHELERFCKQNAELLSKKYLLYFIFREQIFGYSKLFIKIFYSATFLHAYVKVSYLKKIDPLRSEGVSVSIRVLLE